MTTFVSYFLSVVIVLSIVGCLWLLMATSKRRADEPETTGHQWDGDISEYNKPLPRWWLNLFWLTAIWGFAYLAVYPGLGAFKGWFGWSSAKEHAQAQALVDQKFDLAYGELAKQPLHQLAKELPAQQVGRSIFINNCATCHGSEAKGARGFPNLTDQDWLWGGSPETIQASITNGRNGLMPPMGAVLGEEGVRETAVFVQSLAGTQVDATMAARGAQRFQTVCAACHGADGKGNPILGAPNLTDTIWLHGGDYQTLLETIRNGRANNMPAHGEILGPTRTRLVAAWVLAQSKKNDTGESLLNQHGQP